MTNHSEIVNSDYDPEANLDDVLAALATIDPVAAKEANSFMQEESADDSQAEDPLEAYLASNPKAAAEVTSFMEATSPFRKDRRIMQCLKDGRIGDFKREFAVALATPHGTQTVAHLWAHNHLRNERLRHPEVANLLLNLPRFISSQDSKDFLVLVENVVESEGFVPGQHWMVVNARASRLLPGHIVTMMINHGKLRILSTANAFVTCKSLLKRIREPELRMEALRQAFLICDLPPRWAGFARRLGLADSEIAELITLRCRLVLQKRYDTNTPLSLQDINFLKMLLMPVAHGGVSYREVLSDEQLRLVVDAVRRGLQSLPTIATDGSPTFSIQERQALTVLRTQTMGKRYRRR